MNHCCTRRRPTSFRPRPVLTGRPNPALRPLSENRGVHGTGQRLRPAPANRRRRPVGKVAWSTRKGWVTCCVASSLASIALSSSDPTGGFYLRTRQASGNHVTCFGYGGRIPRFIGHGMWGAAGACKRIQWPLLHFARVRGLAAMILNIVGPWE
jgi:hypothetical protein